MAVHATKHEAFERCRLLIIIAEHINIYATCSAIQLLFDKPHLKRYLLKIADERFVVFQKNISFKS